MQREQRLELLHEQAVKKSKELDKRLELNLGAQNSQRGELLTIVEDLTKQLKEQKQSSIEKSTLFAERHAHKETLHQNEEKQGKIEELSAEVQQLRQSLK